MTKFTAEIEYAYQHFMTLVEGTHPRTLSKDHFEHVAGILANAVERAVEAKYSPVKPMPDDPPSPAMVARTGVRRIVMQTWKSDGIGGVWIDTPAVSPT